MAADLQAQTLETTSSSAPARQTGAPNRTATAQPAYSSENTNPAADDITHAASPYDLTISADFGGSSYAAAAARGGPIVGASLLMRTGLFGFGVYAQADTAVFYYQHSSSYGLAAGLAYQSPDGFRLDALGTLGFHNYSGWGGSSTIGDTEYEDNPGGSASLPCAGARLRALYLFSRSRRGHFLLGWQLGLEQDLKREFVHYTTYNPPDQTWVGGFRWTTGRVIGGAIDIGSGT